MRNKRKEKYKKKNIATGQQILIKFIFNWNRFDLISQ